ncbi:MAG: hypothetical protein DRP56_06330 [Planctomycetota bacterium]|nr:MAG: hypothetical protein DRP56_06330 [Planctomycetota bacterium]
MIEHECSECGHIITSFEEVAGEEILCPNCNEEIIVPYEELDYQEENYGENNEENTQSLLFNSEEHRYINNADAGSHHRKQGRLKNLIAIFIGIVVGVFLRVIIAIPLVLIFATDEGLPLDITFILEVFTAFVAGAMAGSLVPRLGWLVGVLTQFFKIIITLVILGSWAFFVATDTEVGMSLNLIREPNFRLMIIAVVIAGVAGAIGEKYRKNIWVFLGRIFGFLAGSFVIVLQFGGGILYLYFLYRGGKALFEDGAVIKALLWVAVIGPLVSGGASILLIGTVMGGGWLFKAIYNWYLPDLGFEEMEEWDL